MFENMFGKKPEEESEKTTETKFTEDETGAVVSQEMKKSDDQFREARE